MCSCSRVTLLTFTLLNMASMNIAETRFSTRNCPTAAKTTRNTAATMVSSRANSGRTICGPHSSPRSRIANRFTMARSRVATVRVTSAGSSSLRNPDTGPISAMRRRAVTRMKRWRTRSTARKAPFDCQTAISMVWRDRKPCTERTSFTALMSRSTRKTAKKEGTSPCVTRPRGSRSHCSTAEKAITVMSNSRKRSAQTGTGLPKHRMTLSTMNQLMKNVSTTKYAWIETPSPLALEAKAFAWNPMKIALARMTPKHHQMKMWFVFTLRKRSQMPRRSEAALCTEH
mmetsp:Transcript_10752/g.34105  ORF Transcript_10752/g.34105 Transcript_10752/m.34105 type:complete len:286 (+) Transcript_10752:925-1782(+)